MSVPLVGCASHRLNLAVQAFYKVPERKKLVTKVHMLMKELRTLKNSSKLRKTTHFHSERRNVTRWGFTHDMLNKYCKIQGVLSSCNFDEDAVAKIPIPRETQAIAELVKSGIKIESVSIALQN